MKKFISSKGLCQEVYKSGDSKPLTGFTLVEVLISLFVVAVGMSAIFGIVNNVLFPTSVSVNRVTASYLAQEGMEIVRNIRDSNWLGDIGGNSWANGMRVGNPSEADYNDRSLIPYTGRYLEINQNGFYEDSQWSQSVWDSSGGTIDGYSQSSFKRKITVTSADPDVINVKVEVIWSERGKDYSVIAEEELYNWI